MKIPVRITGVGMGIGVGMGESDESPWAVTLNPGHGARAPPHFYKWLGTGGTVSRIIA